MGFRTILFVHTFMESRNVQHDNKIRVIKVYWEFNRSHHHFTVARVVTIKKTFFISFTLYFCTYIAHLKKDCQINQILVGLSLKFFYYTDSKIFSWPNLISWLILITNIFLESTKQCLMHGKKVVAILANRLLIYKILLLSQQIFLLKQAKIFFGRIKILLGQQKNFVWWIQTKDFTISKIYFVQWFINKN